MAIRRSLDAEQRPARTMPARPKTASGGLRTVPRRHVGRNAQQPTEPSGKNRLRYDYAWRGAPMPQRTQNRIDCNTKLPDGSTVGDHVNALSNDINNRAQFTSTPYGPSMQIGNRSDPVSVVTDVYRGTNFRKMFGGPGANYAFLGDAGNFAYFSVSGNIGVPLGAAEAAAGAYAYATHSAADRVGPYGMDQSATSQVAGYGACKK